MSKCYNCGTEFTLKSDEIKCDSCGKVVNFLCHNCKQWFSIYDETTNEIIKTCGVCGFYYCPHCGSCGDTCQKLSWSVEIKTILDDENYSQQEKIKQLCELIEEIKLSKEQKVCDRGVPISYAKNRIKSCIVRMKGYRVKDKEDMEVFNNRVEEVLEKHIGEIITINGSREKGSYGQEFRDVFNYCQCLGKLQKVNIKKLINNEEIEFIGYKRIENGTCPFLDLKDLIVKKCPNKECKIKSFPLSETHCCDPRCNYKSGKNKGQPRKLRLKISTKDICQLNRNKFKKEKDAQSKYY